MTLFLLDNDTIMPEAVVLYINDTDGRTQNDVT